MKKSIFRALLAIARAVLQQVLDGIASQLTQVDELVKQKMMDYVNQVVSDMWEGRGADEFVRCINDEAMPMLDDLVDSVTTFSTNINRAVDIIDEADQQAARIAEDLNGVFQAI